MITVVTDFVGEINIPNPTANLEKINRFISKYEPICLESLFGYPLYKSYLQDSSTQRFQDIILGAEYVNMRGEVAKWKGLVYSLSGASLGASVLGFTQFPNQQIRVDVTPGLVSGTNTFTFDGTLGTPDWRGRSIRVDRAETGVMFLDFDFYWDSTTGTFTLLKVGDVFTHDHWFDIIFNPARIIGTSITGDIIYNVVANFIYWWYMKDATIWTSGVGTKIAKGDSVIDVSPALKMNRAWNEFASSTKDFVSFVLSLTDVYPEFSVGIASCVYNWAGTVNEFDI